MTVVLIGMPASGKTTVGCVLARTLGTGFTDTDAIVEARAGMPIAEIFACEGEAAFRRLETDAVREALSLDSDGVVALGGGAIMSDEVRHLLRPHRVFFLDVPVDHLVSRAEQAGDKRPLLLGDISRRMEALAEQRGDVYRSVGVTLDATGDAMAVVERIITCLTDGEDQTSTEGSVDD